MFVYAETVVKMPKTATSKPPLKQTSQLGQKRRTSTFIIRATRASC